MRTHYEVPHFPRLAAVDPRQVHCDDLKGSHQGARDEQWSNGAEKFTSTGEIKTVPEVADFLL